MPLPFKLVAATYDHQWYRSMVVFNNRLCAPTGHIYGDGGRLLRLSEQKDYFDVVCEKYEGPPYPVDDYGPSLVKDGRLYALQAGGMKLMRLNNAGNAWEQVSGDPQIGCLWSMVEFDGDLYGGSSKPLSDGELYKFDFETLQWVVVCQPYPNNGWNYGWVSRLLIFNNRLYGLLNRGAFNNKAPALLVKLNQQKDAWEKVCPPIGEQNNYGEKIVVFNGRIYLGMAGGQIYRVNDDGNDWELVVDISESGQIINEMVVFNDDLYIILGPFNPSGTTSLIKLDTEHYIETICEMEGEHQLICSVVFDNKLYFGDFADSGNLYTIGASVYWTLEFGDGQQISGEGPDVPQYVHQYIQEGTYTLKISADYYEGDHAEDIKTVTVTETKPDYSLMKQFKVGNKSWTRNNFWERGQEPDLDPKGALKTLLDILNAVAITSSKYQEGLPGGLPEWVKLSTFFHDDFLSGNIKDWWHIAFKDNYSLFKVPSLTGTLLAFGDGIERRLTPDNAGIKGNYLFEYGFKFAEIDSGELIGFRVYDAETDDLICKVDWESNNLKFNIGGDEDIVALEFSSFEEIRIKIKRESKIIRAYYSIGGDWVQFNVFGIDSSDEVYIKVVSPLFQISPPNGD